MKNSNKIKELPLADCFSLEQLLHFVEKNVAEEKLRQMEKHIEICDFCSEAIAGYKKVNDKAFIKHALGDINKQIQEKTGVEEGEAIIAFDYRIFATVGVAAALLIGVFFLVKFLLPDKALTPNSSPLTELNVQGNDSALAEEESVLLNSDSINVDTANTVLVNSSENNNVIAENKVSSGSPASPAPDQKTTEMTPDIIAQNSTSSIQAALVPRKSPLFPGGETKAIEFINANKKYPQEAGEKGISGTVKIAFTLDENGKVISTRVVGSGLGGGCNEEAQRIFMSMPNWIPANDGTKNVGGEWFWDIQF
jgi:TonB family protein